MADAGIALPAGGRWFAPVFVLLAALMVFSAPLTDTDLTLHLGMGRAFAQAGVSPADIFSWTAGGTPWTPHEWLFSWMLWQVHLAGGLPALWLFKVALWVGLVLLLLYAVPRECRGVPFLEFMLLALLAGARLWTLRPHFFFLTGLVLTVLVARQVRPRLLTVLGLTLYYLVWANTHASVLLGVGLWLLWRLPLLRNNLRRETLTLLLLTLATLANPAGASLWLWPLSLLAGGKPGFVQEWGSIAEVLMTVPGMLFIIFTLMLALAVKRDWCWRPFRWHEQPFPWRELVLWLGFTAWALLSRRMIAPAAVSGILLAGALSATGGQWLADDKHTRRDVVILLGLALLSLAGWWLPAPGAALAPQLAAQTAAVEHIRAHPPAGGRLFNDYAWGGAVMLYGWPDLKTFVDGRTEVFSSQLLADYGILYQAQPGWRVLLDHYAITGGWLPAAAPLAQELLADPLWRRDAAVGNGMVYLTRVDRPSPGAVAPSSPAMNSGRGGR